MSQMTFNGVSLFANTSNSGDQSVFKSDSTSNTVSIHTSTQGSQGSKISFHKAALLAALTLEVGDLKGTEIHGEAVYDPTLGGGGQIGGVAAGDRFTNASTGIDKPNSGQFISFAAEILQVSGTWMQFLWAFSTGVREHSLLTCTCWRSDVTITFCSRYSFGSTD